MIVASLAVTFLCYVKAGLIPSNYMATIESVASSETSVPSSYLQSSSDNKQYFKWGAGIMSIVTVMLVVITVAMIKRIRVAINILKASTKVLASIPFLTLWPFFTVFFVVAAVGVWIITSIFIATMSTEIPSNLGSYNTSDMEFTVGNESLSLTELDTKEITTYLNIFNFFMFLWTNQVVQGVGIMTIAGAVCELYWRREDAVRDGLHPPSWFAPSLPHPRCTVGAAVPRPQLLRTHHEVQPWHRLLWRLRHCPCSIHSGLHSLRGATVEGGKSEQPYRQDRSVRHEELLVVP